MPYASDAQRRYFHANKAELESQGVDVDEWDRASKGKDLPERAGGSKRKKKKRKKSAQQRKLELTLLKIALGYAGPSPPRPGACAALPVLEAVLGRLQGQGGGDPSVVSAEAPSKQGSSAAPSEGQPDGGLDPQLFDAVKVALAVKRRDHLCLGPARTSWLGRRRLVKAGIGPALAGPMSVNADPATAYDQLMAMMRPGPPVPVAGAGGTGLPSHKPGGELGERNTPTTNPIGLLSGLGTDPGGESVMGNAGFGTQNSVVKTGQWGTNTAPMNELNWPDWFRERVIAHRQGKSPPSTGPAAPAAPAATVAPRTVLPRATAVPHPTVMNRPRSTPVKMSAVAFGQAAAGDPQAAPPAATAPPQQPPTGRSRAEIHRQAARTPKPVPRRRPSRLAAMPNMYGD